MKVIEKAKGLYTKVGNKAFTTAMTAAVAVNTLALNALAAEDGGVDISSVTSSITSTLTDLVSKAAVACAGVVGAGLTIFGLKWVVQKIMSFFKAIGK